MAARDLKAARTTATAKGTALKAKRKQRLRASKLHILMYFGVCDKHNGLCSGPFPLTGILTLEMALKRSRGKYGTLAALPAFLAFIVFGCAHAFRMAGFAITPMPPVKSEGHDLIT
jgi:hypothetical protein